MIAVEFRTWYMNYGTWHEPQDVLTVWTLLTALFGLGLALGVSHCKVYKAVSDYQINQ